MSDRRQGARAQVEGERHVQRVVGVVIIVLIGLLPGVFDDGVVVH